MLRFYFGLLPVHKYVISGIPLKNCKRECKTASNLSALLARGKRVSFPPRLHHCFLFVNDNLHNSLTAHSCSVVSTSEDEQYPGLTDESREIVSAAKKLNNRFLIGEICREGLPDVLCIAKHFHGTHRCVGTNVRIVLVSALRHMELELLGVAGRIPM